MEGFEEVVEVKVATPAKTKKSGVAENFINRSTGVKKVRRKKTVFHVGDSVEDMEKSTVDLLADSSRKIIKTLEQEENRRINDILGRSYVPTKHENDIKSQELLVRSKLNLV